MAGGRGDGVLMIFSMRRPRGERRGLHGGEKGFQFRDFFKRGGLHVDIGREAAE